MTQKNTFLLKNLLFASIFAMAILVTLAPLAPVEAKEQTLQSKSANTSVIRTSDIKKTRLVIKKYGLRETKITPLPHGKALVTVQGNASSAQGLQQEVRDDADSTLYPNHTYTPAASPNDPLYSNNSQWNLTKINAGAAWDTTTGSSDTTIAVIDSGVLFSQGWAGSTDCAMHTPCSQPDFPVEKAWVNPNETGPALTEGAAPNCTSQGRTLDKSCNNLDDDNNGYVDDQKGWDFMGGWRGDSATCPNFASPTTYESIDFPGYVTYDNDPQPYSCDSPSHQNELNRNHHNGTCEAFESACYTSHGTAVASVAAAATNNNALIAGVNWSAKIMSVRALDGYGWGDSAHIAAAVEYATVMNADVINLSLAVSNNEGCTATDALLEEALASAKAAGIVIVAAAGNGGTEGVCYPGRSIHAIGVGASNSTDGRASFSSYGSEIDVVAPGANIPAALAPNKASGYVTSTLYSNGTSLATPHVAGLAALLVTTQPTLDPDDIRGVITQSASKVAGMNSAPFTNEYGYGRINAYDAVTTAPPTYAPLDFPRKMRLAAATQKTNLLSLEKSGQTFGKDLVMQFETKVHLNGAWYLRTKYDTDNGNHFGFPLSALADVPPEYAPLQEPREMWLNAAMTKTHLITGAPTGSTLERERIIHFTSKTLIGDTLYLRSKYDTDHGIHHGIPYSVLRNLPEYVRLDTPRTMTLSADTQKTNLLTGDPISATLTQGKTIRFETKTLIGNTWYLRSQYDTNNKIHHGIPRSLLQDS